MPSLIYAARAANSAMADGQAFDMGLDMGLVSAVAMGLASADITGDRYGVDTVMYVIIPSAFGSTMESDAPLTVAFAYTQPCQYDIDMSLSPADITTADMTVILPAESALCTAYIKAINTTLQYAKPLHGLIPKCMAELTTIKAAINMAAPSANWMVVSQASNKADATAVQIAITLTDYLAYQLARTMDDSNAHVGAIFHAVSLSVPQIMQSVYDVTINIGFISVVQMAGVQSNQSACQSAVRTTDRQPSVAADSLNDY